MLLPDRSLGDTGHVSDHDALHERYNRSVDVLSGLASARPAATTVADGTLYWSTDTQRLSRSDGTVWSDLAAGATDHGALTGLGDDDHPQYATDVDLASTVTAFTADLASHDHAGGDGAQIDHGLLAGLAFDDHTQYLNAARHAAVDAADHGSGGAADGDVLTADGSGGAAWAAPAGGGDVVYADNGDTSPVAINSLSDVTVKSTTVTGVAVGDTIIAELVGSILNVSTQTVTWTFTPDFDGAFVPEFSSSGNVSGPTNRFPIRVRWHLSVQSSAAADLYAEVFRTPQAAAGVFGSTAPSAAWDTVSADLTGSVDVSLKVRSNSVTAAQQFLVYSFVVRKVPST